MLLTLPLMEQLSPGAFEAISQLLKDSYSAYDELFNTAKEIVNAPLILTCGNFLWKHLSKSSEVIDPAISE